MAHKKNKKRKTAYQKMDDFETHFNVVMKRAKTNYITQDVAEWIMLNFLMVIDEYFARNEDSKSFTKEQKVRMLARLACMIDENLTPVLHKVSNDKVFNVDYDGMAVDWGIIEKGEHLMYRQQKADGGKKRLQAMVVSKNGVAEMEKLTSDLTEEMEGILQQLSLGGTPGKA